MSNQEELPTAIQEYFECLERGEFEAAANCFTEDCVYYHPPSYQAEIKIEGRDDLLTYFAEARGMQDIDHELEKVTVGDNQVAFVAQQSGADTGDDHFISFAELDGGKISYYMAGFLKGETVTE